MFCGNMLMALKVFLSSTLRKCHPGYEPSPGIVFELKDDISVAALLRELKVPQDRVKIVMVDGMHASLDHLLKGDERVAFFPPVGGG
jgi:sulfur-carrier protein